MNHVTSDDVMAQISAILSPIDVSPQDNFDDLETTSVHMLRLMVSLQRQFEVDIDVVDMFEVEYVRDLVQLVVSRLPREGVPAS